ncbi:MAG: TIGR03663 family protein [Bdellovibrionaceae bacterium]|nr:TIGR03663 family protein [Pseudobdellovibrionaceae bacterium]
MKKRQAQKTPAAAAAPTEVRARNDIGFRLAIGRIMQPASMQVRLAVVFAFVSRLLFLDWKAPHFDESINGHFVDQIWINGFFRYDPTNFHGPLYFYLLHLAELLLGRGVESFRFVTGLLSVGCVILAARHERYLGRAAHGAAWVLALSPAFVFYGRYAIHETLLVFGQLLFSLGFLRWRSEGGRAAVAWMAAGVVIAVTTKETFFIFFGTWAIAWGLLAWSERLLPSRLTTRLTARLTAREPWPSARSVGGENVWLWASALSAVAILAFFSGFFVYPKGVSDGFAAFAFWAKTGAGESGHEKPFFYWLDLLWRYEWPVLLTLLLAPLMWFRGSIWMRFFTLVGVGLWLAYSLIPYKTPWCILAFVWPLAFSFGFLLSEIRQKLGSGILRRGLVVIGVVSLAVSAWTAVRLSFRDYERMNEPYVYVQTTHDVPKVMWILEERVKREPEARTLRIQVVHRESWPFPWLLARFSRAEFTVWNPKILLHGEVILADAADAQEIEAKLTRRYYRTRLHLRDSYGPGYAYFEVSGFAPWFSASDLQVGPRRTSSVGDVQ